MKHKRLCIKNLLIILVTAFVLSIGLTVPSMAESDFVGAIVPKKPDVPSLLNPDQDKDEKGGVVGTAIIIHNVPPATGPTSVAPGDGAPERLPTPTPEPPPPPIIPQPDLAPLAKLPKAYLEGFTVEGGYDGTGQYIIPRFSVMNGGGEYREKDGFLIDFETPVAITAGGDATYDAGNKSGKFYLFCRSGEKAMVPQYRHISRVYPAIWGLISVAVWNEKTAKMETTLQSGYVIGNPWEEEMNRDSIRCHIQGQEAMRRDMPAHHDDQTVSWEAIKRHPKIFTSEVVHYGGKERIQPMYPVQVGQCFDLQPGFWVQPFFNPPDWQARFDGLIINYLDMSMMEFGASANAVSARPGGRDDYIVTVLLDDDKFRQFVKYYPEDHFFTNLWIKAFVIDRTSGKERLIMGPSLSRKYWTQ